MAKARQNELCHRYIICPGLMQLPDTDFYIPYKAFTFKFSFSLDPPNSKAIIAAEQYEFGNLAGAQALAASSCGGPGVAVAARRQCRRGGCSATAVLENNKEVTKAARM